MITVRIESGICGFYTTVRASKTKQRTIEMAIESDCKQITALSNHIESMGLRDVLKTPINKNPVYEKAGTCNLHSSCPVPCGVLKAAEAELGIALKKDAKIEFLDENNDTA